MDSLLHPYAAETIVPRLSGLIGLQLKSVIYRPLTHECTVDDISRPDFYLGAEIALTFNGFRKLYISWDTKVPYGHDIAFGLCLSDTPVFPDDVVESHDASQTPLWLPHIESRVIALKLYGYSGTPFVLGLTTQNGRIYMGSAYQTQFGDGDDVFATDSIDNQPILSPLWSAPSHANDEESI